MENYGTTQTRDLAGHINTMMGPNVIPKNFTFPDAGDRGSDNAVPVIGPKDKFPLVGGPVPRDFIERLYRHELHLYFYGWVRYNDIFDKTPRHITRFCYEVVAGGVTRLPSGQEGQGVRVVTIGTRFNCFDEECRDQ